MGKGGGLCTRCNSPRCRLIARSGRQCALALLLSCLLACRLTSLRVCLRMCPRATAAIND